MDPLADLWHLFGPAPEPPPYCSAEVVIVAVAPLLALLVCVVGSAFGRGE